MKEALVPIEFSTRGTDSIGTATCAVYHRIEHGRPKNLAEASFKYGLAAARLKGG